ncbi:FMN-binding negative transcriptional regulator [Caulobacter mirabilis]|uniref:Transcriptional regulator n=1 Tax=Caulobacter mirabilis TaxID=69666 RepID=A0A2D2B0A4_9CAUL|nr:FMN-binding negative transcriptional regulator [Caulobacter mirabilis]ATQ43685.1 transcriptional regulator [Caulobacter mirabilis]
MAGGTFDNWTEADAIDLVREYPMAWLVSGGEAFAATPLPLLPDLDGDGRLVGLTGHMARANPHVARLRERPRAYVLFQGSHGYISPSWFRDRSRAPTWNYAILKIEADIVFDPAGVDEALQRLVETMEKDRPRPWSADEMGPRYERLRRGVVAFQARIVSLAGRFKLGQDEPDEVYEDIMAEVGGSDLGGWMSRLGRL